MSVLYGIMNSKRLIDGNSLIEWLNGHINIGKPANNYTEGRVDAYNITLREVERGQFDIDQASIISQQAAEIERLKQELKECCSALGYEEKREPIEDPFGGKSP